MSEQLSVRAQLFDFGVQPFSQSDNCGSVRVNVLAVRELNSC